MTIAFQSATNAATTTTNSTSLAINKPTSTAQGDLLVIGMAYILGQTITTLSGWTLAGTQAGPAGVEVKMFYKVATSSEGSSYTWSYTLDSGSSASLVAMTCARFTGTHQSSPAGVTASSSAASATSLAPGTLTGAASTSLGVSICGVRPDLAGDPVLTNASGNSWVADANADAISATTSSFDAAVALSYRIGSPSNNPTTNFSTTAACEFASFSSEFLINPFISPGATTVTRLSVMSSSNR